MDAAGLLFDNSLHYLDHLAPFCSLMSWPLIIFEPEIAETARRYYPDLKIQEELDLPPIIVSCDPSAILQTAFTIKTLFWLPHGHSDKGWKIPIFDALDREIPLVYGQNMAEKLQHKNPIRIGNFRYHYFAKHRAFYESITPRGPFTLYAPTWDDLEGNSSFWETLPTLAKLPLIAKIHPNTYRKFPAELETLAGKHPHIHFLFDFPPVYPLLEQASTYIGDMSSIGYDFLYYNRPMFFFPAQPIDLPLFRCGRIGFDSSDQNELNPIRQALYTSTFDPIDTWDTIAKQLYERL